MRSLAILVALLLLPTVVAYSVVDAGTTEPAGPCKPVLTFFDMTTFPFVFVSLQPDCLPVLPAPGPP